MVAAANNLSVAQQQRVQRRERFLGAAVLLAGALVCAALLARYEAALPLAIVLAALAFAVAIARNPRLGLYTLFFTSLFLEQWGIAGLDPITARLPFYQTLAGAGIAPIPVSPVEMVLLLTLVALMLPHVARRGGEFVRGPLFVPFALFTGFVVVSLAYGVAGGRGAGPFDVRAAWEETRAFFYLAITYLLAANLLKTRRQLNTFVWLFIAAIAAKSVQGVVRYIYMRANDLQLDAITGHEDVVFFSAFVLLFAGFVLFGGKASAVTRRQRLVMGLTLLPLLFTLLATNRRIGFLVLGAGFVLLAVALLRTRRDLFFRIVPAALVALTLYTALFWNNTGTLGQPIRSVRSIFAPATERDRSSNAWRDLENYNIGYNIRQAPLTGLGFGKPFSFAVAQPALDATGFTYWRFIAHNAIYWVWMKMGLAGFLLFWNLMGSAVVLGIVLFRRLKDSYLKALALLGAGVVIMQIIFSYGDLGLTYTRSMVFLGCIAGMLARLPAMEEPAAQTEGAPQRWYRRWQRPRMVEAEGRAA